MNRRSFLKALGFGAGAAVVAPTVLAELAEAAPNDGVISPPDAVPWGSPVARMRNGSITTESLSQSLGDFTEGPNAHIRLHGLDDDPRPVQFAASSGGSISNSNEIVWTSMPYSAEYTAWSLWTEPRGGTLLMSGPAYANSVVAGDTLHISPGSLRVSLHSA